MIKMTDKQAADIAYLKMLYKDVCLLDNGEFLVSTVREILDIVDDDRDIGEIYLLDSDFGYKAIYDYGDTHTIRSIKRQNPDICSLETIDRGTVDTNKSSLDPLVLFQVVQNIYDCEDNDVKRYATEIICTDGKVLNLWDKTGKSLQDVEKYRENLANGLYKCKTDIIDRVDNLVINDMRLYSAKYYIPEYDNEEKFRGYSKRVQVIYKETDGDSNDSKVLIRGDTDIYRFLVDESDGRHLYIYGVSSNIVIDYNIDTKEVKSESINKATIINKGRYSNIDDIGSETDERLDKTGLCGFIDRLLMLDGQNNTDESIDIIRHTSTVYGSTCKIYTKKKVYIDRSVREKAVTDELDDRFEFLDIDNMIYRDKRTDKIYIASLGDFFMPFNGLMIAFTESMSENDYEGSLGYHTYTSGKQEGSESNSNFKFRLITSIGSEYFINRLGQTLGVYRLVKESNKELNSYGIVDKLVKLGSIDDKLGSGFGRYLNIFRSINMNISAGARVLKNKAAYVIEAKGGIDSYADSSDTVAIWFKAFYFDSGLLVEYEIDSKYASEQHKDEHGFRKLRYNAVSCKDIGNNSQEISLDDSSLADLKEVMLFKDLGMVSSSTGILDTNKLKQAVTETDFGKKLMLDLL